MSHRNHRSMPHPVLSHQREDYAPECAFSILTPQTALAAGGKDIAITVKYLLDSPALLNLIDEGKAKYVALVECTRTYRRESYPAASDEDIILLKRDEWQGTLSVAPYVAATNDIAGFSAPEHSAIVKALAPEGMDLPAGAILAIGDITEVELDEDTGVESIFDLASDRQLRKGTFGTDLTGERIAISLHPDDKNKVDTLRNQNRYEPILHQGLYLYALDKAICNLTEHGGKRWAAVVQQKLEEHDIPIEGEDLIENSQRYAQLLFKSPLERMLNALHEENGNE